MTRYNDLARIQQQNPDYNPPYPHHTYRSFEKGTVVQLATDTPLVKHGDDRFGYVEKGTIGVIRSTFHNGALHVAFPNRRLRVVPWDLKILRHVHKDDIVTGMKVHAVDKDFSKDNPMAIGEVTTFAGPYVKVFFPHLGREVGLFRTQLYPATVENKSLKRALITL